MDEKMKKRLEPILSMSLMKLKDDKSDSSDMSKEKSFEDEGVKAAVEQMMFAIKEMPYMGGLNSVTDEKIGDNESPEAFQLRKKAKALRDEADRKQKEAYLDAFAEGLCSFIELKFDLSPKEEYSDMSDEAE